MSVFQGGRRLCRTFNGLGITTWEDLAQFSEGELLKINGLGRYSMDYIRSGMAKRGLSFQRSRQIEFGVRLESMPSICGVYFMACGEFVKIGSSRDIHDRMASLATANPYICELVGYISTENEAGARKLERELHRRFKLHHHRLEWFRLTDEIRAYIGDQHGRIQ